MTKNIYVRTSLLTNFENEVILWHEMIVSNYDIVILCHDTIISSCAQLTISKGISL